MDESKTAAVKFKEPPPRREAPYDWAAIAKKLRRRAAQYPGDPEKWWALVYEDGPNSYAVAIRQAKITALRPTRGFEVKTTNNKRTNPRTCDLYLRYVPEKDEEK